MGPVEAQLISHYDETRRKLRGLPDPQFLPPISIAETPRIQVPSVSDRLNEVSDRLNEIESRLSAVEGQTRTAISVKSNPDISVEYIILTVCQHEQVRRNLLTGGRRTKDLCLVRHYIFYLAAKLTTKSLVTIGRRFGDRDHTTVLYGVRKLTAQRPFDLQLDARLNFYENIICPGLN